MYSGGEFIMLIIHLYHQQNKFMKGQDLIILVKKIIVGIIITAVPLIIFLVGLWLVRKSL
jgi:hypothetical protein